MLKRNRVPKNLSREELKRWVREAVPDTLTQCPVCGVELKVSSLIRHTDQQHR